MSHTKKYLRVVTSAGAPQQDLLVGSTVNGSSDIDAQPVVNSLPAAASSSNVSAMVLDEDSVMDVDADPNVLVNPPAAPTILPPLPANINPAASAAQLRAQSAVPPPIPGALGSLVQAAGAPSAAPVPLPVVTAHELGWFTAPADYSLVPPELYNGVGRLQWIGVEKPNVDEREPWDYFQLMFPMQFLSDIVQATAANGVDGFDTFEFFQMLGLLLAQGCDPRPSTREWWGEHKDDRLVQPRVREMGFTLARDRFEKIVSGLKFGHYSADDIRADPWSSVAQLVQSFNQRRAQVVIPGRRLCVHEDTSKWTPTRSEAKCNPGGVPVLTKIKAKLEPVSIKLKTLCDYDTNIKLFLEIQEDKARMERKQYGNLGAGTAGLLRLTQPYFGTHRIVCADSAFASVKSAVQLYSRNLYFMGVVKTATETFPKTYLSSYPFRECGQHLALKACSNNVNLVAAGWATRGFPKRAGKKTKVHTLIATCGSTAAGNPYEKQRQRVGENGALVKTTYIRAQPRLVEEYFEVAKVIDVHNHYRQSGLALERAVQTKSWTFRLFCTILGIVEVDAYFAYCYDRRDDVDDVMDHSEFTFQLIKALFENPYKQDDMQRRKRNRALVDDNSPENARTHVHPHVLLPLSQTRYFENLRQQHPNERNNCHRRCQTCGKKAAYYCKQCSVDDADKKKSVFMAFCGPGTNRPCFETHLKGLNE